jgi:hypothetical protein
MKITPEYLEQNRKLHKVGNYGVSGQRWALSVLNVCARIGSRDVLDYGCGQRTLERELGFQIKNYDPCIPGLDDAPLPADIVACTDVLEHIEPGCLDAVLDDLQRVTRKIGFFVLIQEGVHWWLPKLESRFAILQVKEMSGEFAVVVRPL